MPGVASLEPAIPGVSAGPRSESSRFTAALVASLAIHAVLLAGWHGLTRPSAKAARPPAALLARLMAPEAAVAPKPEPEPAPQRLEPPSPPAPLQRPPRRAETAPVAAVPAPPAREAPTPQAVPEPPSAASASGVASPAPGGASLSAIARPEAAGGAPLVPPSSSAPAASTANSATAAPRGEAEPGTLRQYQLAVVVAARKFKRYPRVALDNNWEGKAEVRMVIGASGAIVSLQVKTSSGHEALDKVALDMVARAMPLAPIPPALRGREFVIEVPVVFSLAQEAAGGG